MTLTPYDSQRVRSLDSKRLFGAAVVVLSAACSQPVIDGRLDPSQPGPPGAGADGGGGGPIGGDAGVPQACASDRDYFVEQISRPILETDCMSCHTSTGLAKDTRLVLVPPADEPSIQVNYNTLRAVAADQRDGISLLLLKPTSRVSHGGGQRFTVGSDRHRAFLQLVERFGTPGSCAPGAEIDVCATAAINPGGAVLRRLTSRQYANTIRDLFDGRVAPSPAFPQTSVTSGFNTYASANIVSAPGAEAIFTAAEAVAADAVEDLPALLACAQGQAEADCVAAFVERFGRRAFRRPLTAAELETLNGLYANNGALPLADRVGMILEALLQSPQFLYLDESSGTALPGQAGVEKLDGFGIASKLAYLIWETTPDQALLDLAAQGGLDTAQQVGAKAREMLDDPRARDVISSFHRDWLQLYALDGQTRDRTLYPEFDAALIAAMRGEVDRFANAVIFEAEGTFDALMTSNRGFTNQLLDPVYGLSSGSSGPNDWRELPLDVSKRGGLLTRAAFLAAQSYSAASSPIARGVFVLREVLCQELEMPPGLMIDGLPESTGETVAERLASHRSQALCASCHDKIDPIGFAFENYDAIGRWRDQYSSGHPIVPGGTVPLLGGSFTTPLEMVGLISNLETARSCYATSWFRYAFGRVETRADQCAVRALQERFDQSNGDIKDLIVGITESDAFLYRRSPE